MNELTKITPKEMPIPMSYVQEGCGLLDRLMEAITVSKQCRVAIRQLEVEERRIKEEFKTHRVRISSETQIRLEELRNERLHREKQLEILGDSLKQLLKERSRIMDWIEQARRDGEYEFADQCTRMHSEACAEQSEVRKLISLSAPNEHKQIGG